GPCWSVRSCVAPVEALRGSPGVALEPPLRLCLGTMKSTTHRTFGASRSFAIICRPLPASKPSLLACLSLWPYSRTLLPPWAWSQLH
ncbi:hypothetical protein LEMLEM_LOCUS9273, partial [Lemmus lemmus]